MLYEEILDERVDACEQFYSGGLVPLDVAVGFMGQGIYVEEIEFDVNHFHFD
jgi:hypothetical protein